MENLTYIYLTFNNDVKHTSSVNDRVYPRSLTNWAAAIEDDRDCQTELVNSPDFEDSQNIQQSELELSCYAPSFYL